MDIPIPMDVPMIDQVKIQARVLVPLVKALEAELGAARAHGLVREVLADQSRRMAETFRDMLPGDTPVEQAASALPIFTAGDALDTDVLEQTSASFAFNVTGCRYAEFYRGIGDSDLGCLLVCSGDAAAAEALSPDLQFDRSQTIMQGADHCDCCYRLRPPSGT